MNRSKVVLFAFILVALAAPRLRAQDQSPFITDFVGNLEHVEGQVLALEGAMPQDKYSWRPMEGVRSVGEVYRHIAGGNYLLLQLMGVQPPAGVANPMDEKTWDTGTMDKAAVTALLKDSFDFVKKSASGMTEKDLSATVDMFGNKMTKRGAMMLLLTHIHEHLGQAIAYARMNSVVPPWTAAEMAKEAEKNKGK